MPTTLEEFQSSLARLKPPIGLSTALTALWFAANNDWYKAHELADKHEDHGGAWVHAYLHRLEGDEWNARYWYRRANQPFFKGSFQDEWKHISQTLLKG